MRHFSSELRRLVTAPDGATSIEYAVIACGIAGVLISVVNALGGSVLGLFTSVANTFH